MDKKPDRKEITRLKMLDAVGREFRKNGFTGIGVDGLAKAAGVTSGAFYSHFGSKDGAFEAALVTGLDEVIENIPDFQQQHGASWVKAFADYYLGKPHQKNLECGCAMAALTTEVIRFDAKVHMIYEKKMGKIVDLVAKGLVGSSEKDRRGRAWSMLGVLIGGLNVTRAMKSGKASEEVADAIKTAAIKAAGQAKTVTD